MISERCRRFIKESIKEIIISTAISVTAAIAFSLWRYFSGDTFRWIEFHPLADPTLPVRLLSGLVFLSIGRILYELKFYYVLYMILVVFLRMKELYYGLKKLIWHSLMFVMGTVIVPWIIDTINSMLSFFYNIYCAILYIFPALGIGLAVFIITFLICKAIAKGMESVVVEATPLPAILPLVTKISMPSMDGIRSSRGPYQ